MAVKHKCGIDSPTEPTDYTATWQGTASVALTYKVKIPVRWTSLIVLAMKMASVADTELNHHSLTGPALYSCILYIYIDQSSVV